MGIQHGSLNRWNTKVFEYHALCSPPIEATEVGSSSGPENQSMQNMHNRSMRFASAKFWVDSVTANTNASKAFNQGSNPCRPANRMLAQ